MITIIGITPTLYYFLQGICDDQRQFLDVFVRSPGSTHDVRHLRMSFIWQRMQNE